MLRLAADTYNALRWLFYLKKCKKFDNSVLTNGKLRGKIIKYEQKTKQMFERKTANYIKKANVGVTSTRTSAF